MIGANNIKAYIDKIIAFVQKQRIKKKESKQLSVDATRSGKSLAYLDAEDVKVVV